MPKYQQGECLKVGVDFIQFLKEDDQRRSITDQKRLKKIYNKQYKDSRAGDGVMYPNFSSVLSALKCSGQAEISSGNVYFTVAKDQQQQQQMLVQDIGPGTSKSWTKHKPAQTGEQAWKKENKAEIISVNVTSDPEPNEARICLTVQDHKVVPLYVINMRADSIRFTLSMGSGSINCFTLRGERGFNQGMPFKLGPGKRCEIQVHCHTSQPGVYRACLEFKIDHPDQYFAHFSIVRFLEVTYRTSLGQGLTQTSPYKPCSTAPETSSCPRIVMGRPPDRNDNLARMNLKTKVALKEYEVPDFVIKLMKVLRGIIAGSHIGKLSIDKAMLESPLTWRNYSQKFQLLLFLEELQMEEDIKKYNLVDVPMVRDKSDTNLILLQVPGDTEKHASLLRGGQVLVRPSEEPEGPESPTYQGYIHHVDEDQVELGFGKEFLDRFTEGMKFSVEFIVNRLVMRIQHRAVEFASLYSLKEVLFPNVDPISYKTKQTSTLSLFNSQLMQNREQYKAVKQIVAGSSIPAPYLVFGPPGTGKTVTVVEAIMQIEKKQASCHILACAPSNSAADLLWERLLDGMEEKDKVFRLYAFSHSGVIPQKRQPYCNKKAGSIVIPSKEELMQYKIMVTTLQTASRLVTGGIPTGFYTHIFVDEAGCTPETTCIIPLAGLLNPETGQVVLVGDPKQLGPMISSSLAHKYDMGVSLLERLMSVQLYKKKKKKEEGMKFNKRFITKLLKNYRSHPDILKIPNDLFYEGELKFCADEKICNSYSRWKHLPTKDFPVIFHGVVGTNEREAKSPSFFNIAEVEVLMDYVKKLVNGLRRIKPKHIGIIAPYRKQVEKIRKALEMVEEDLGVKNLDNITVGTVEEFQGKESQVILVSTVRSSPKWIKKGQQINLGFVKNEKRFNVAMTRAQALLIVVGDPTVLKTDSTWDRFIQYCSDKGGYCDIGRSHGPMHKETRRC